MDTVFLLIRHGTSEAFDYVPGRKDGVHLAEEGRRQVSELAERLKEVHIDKIFCSPITRTVETAGAIAEKKGMKPDVVPDIMEIDYGEWTGKTFAELKTIEDWNRFNSFRSGVRPPGGETMLEVQSRMIRAIEKIWKENLGKTVALVSHGDPIRSAILYFTGMPIDNYRRIKITTASVSVLKLNEWGAQVVCLNHTGILPTLD